MNPAFKIQPDQSPQSLELIEKMEKQLRENRLRKKVLAPGDKVSFVYNGDEGFTVVIPDPADEICPDCLCSEKWEFLDMEAESPFEYEARFECKNIVQDEMGPYECQGRIVIKESV